MSQSPPLSAPSLTVAKLAAHWGVSETFVYDLLNSGQLRGFKLGSKLWRIRPEAVEEYERRAARG